MENDDEVNSKTIKSISNYAIELKGLRRRLITVNKVR